MIGKDLMFAIELRYSLRTWIQVDMSVLMGADDLRELILQTMPSKGPCVVGAIDKAIENLTLSMDLAIADIHSDERKGPVKFMYKPSGSGLTAVCKIASNNDTYLCSNDQYLLEVYRTYPCPFLGEVQHLTHWTRHAASQLEAVRKKIGRGENTKARQLESYKKVGRDGEACPVFCNNCGRTVEQLSREQPQFFKAHMVNLHPELKKG
jgi:hypothetical protein